MKAKSLKVLALLLVAVMMIGVFAACDNSTPSTTPAATTTAAPDGTTAAPTTVNTSNEHSLTIMVMNSIGGDYDMNNVDQLEVWTYAKELLAEYGVTVELQVIESDQYETALQTTLANPSSMPDMMFCALDESFLTQAADNGILATLQDILAYSDGTASAFYYEDHPLYMARSAYNGKNYWFGEYQEVVYSGEYQGPGMGAPTGINVREDWLIKLGMNEVPDTLEEIKAYVKACQDNDVNETGVVDEVMCLKVNGAFVDGGVKNFFGVPSQEFHPNLTTGEIDLAWESKNIKEYLKEMQSLFAEGYMTYDAIGAESEGVWYKNNKAATYASYYCNNWSITPDNCAVPEGDPQVNIIGVCIDKTVHPDAYIGHDASPTMDNRKMIVNANADLEAVAHVLDILISDEWNEMLEWGVEGWSYEVNDAGEKVLINGAEVGHTALADPENAVAGRPVISFGIFPDVWTLYDLAVGDEPACDSELELAQFRKAQNEYPVIYPNQIASYLAVATPEEIETLSELETDFMTLSDELYAQILLGNYNVDEDWDDIIGQLNDAGMQEIKAVYQARYDRWYEAYQAAQG